MAGPRQLRSLLARPGIVVAPGAFDPVSARLVEREGFEAVYVGSYATAAARLGLPDAGLLGMREMVDHAAAVVGAVDRIPVIADAENGFGTAATLWRTVREFERAGVAGIHLEDHEFGKHLPVPGRVLPAAAMVEKVRAAIDARSDPDFVIIARTDARAVTGLDDAIARGNLAAEAGADLIFVEAPQTVDEIARVAREVKAPLLANMVQGGKTPTLPVTELDRLGFKVVIFPAVCMAAAVMAMETALVRLRDTGTDWSHGPVLGPMDLFRRVGFDWWHGLEERFRE